MSPHGWSVEAGLFTEFHGAARPRDHGAGRQDHRKGNCSTSSGRSPTGSQRRPKCTIDGDATPEQLRGMDIAATARCSSPGGTRAGAETGEGGRRNPSAGEGSWKRSRTSAPTSRRSARRDFHRGAAVLLFCHLAVITELNGGLVQPRAPDQHLRRLPRGLEEGTLTARSRPGSCSRRSSSKFNNHPPAEGGQPTAADRAGTYTTSPHRPRCMLSTAAATGTTTDPPCVGHHHECTCCSPAPNLHSLARRRTVLSNAAVVANSYGSPSDFNADAVVESSSPRARAGGRPRRGVQRLRGDGRLRPRDDRITSRGYFNLVKLL